MQLVAHGAQDIYLTGNPQITFFRVVYRRHTNFSMEAIEQTFNGSELSGGRVTATISRNGDLVHKMYLQVEGAGKSSANLDNPGASYITDVEIQIGGQKIDKHSGTWMETWAELTQPNHSGTVATNALATATLFQKMSAMGGVNGQNDIASGKYFIPLQFWFCRNPGLALPLIALQYHEVKIVLNHTIDSVWATSSLKHKLWADYIYLDTDERRRFAQVSHEYLIEQVQEQNLNTSTSAGTKTDLNFNHPVKELIWTVKNSKVSTTSGGTISSNRIISNGTYQLKLNGHDRFAARDYRYFSRVQVYEYHSGAGGIDCSGTGAGKFDDSIGVYSFALKPEEHQPSGTCNFSRIDNAQLVTTGTRTDSDTIFAVNYNVLRIMSGMGGLAYSN